MGRSLLKVVLVALVVVGWLSASVSWAEPTVLGGMPTYCLPDGAVPDPPRVPSGPGDLTAAQIPDGPDVVYRGANPKVGVPTYIWWYGCSPTSGGMMVGYWDQLPGFGRLYDGDASVWSGSGASGTKRMVASTAHITAGSENGFTYGDWHNSASHPTHVANPDCIADFMKTVDGGSYSNNITAGLEGYVEWDDPSTAANNESYPATATRIGGFTYAQFKAEIDACRPVLLNVMTIAWVHIGGGYYQQQELGHSIVGYGYQDNMFQIKDPFTSANLTVGGYAVKDTWSPGTAQSEWANWSMGLFPPVIDGNGVEWWPYLNYNGWSWVYTSPPGGPYDWMVSEAVTLVVVPEPATMGLLSLGFLGLGILRRRRGRK